MQIYVCKREGIYIYVYIYCSIFQSIFDSLEAAPLIGKIKDFVYVRERCVPSCYSADRSFQIQKALLLQSKSMRLIVCLINRAYKYRVQSKAHARIVA